MRFTIVAAATLSLLAATAAGARPYTCAQCQPFGSDCTEEAFAAEPITATVSDPHFERTLTEHCTHPQTELWCGREFDRNLYTFGSVRIERGDVAATPTELQAEYDFDGRDDPEWGGVRLWPGKTYIVAIADTRIFNRRFTIMRACELYPSKGA